MKKGIVMERHRKYTILMTKDGSFVKGRVLSNQSEIGEEVVFRPIGNRQVMLRKQRGIPWKVSLLAAAILLVVLPMYFLSNGEKTFAYVTVDINPSIEMQVDDQFEVQRIEAINDDGEEIIKALNEYEHHSIEEVIREIIIESEDHGFASEKNMVVGISYLGEDISNSVPNHLQDYLSTLQEWRVATLIIPEKIRELAQEEKTSMNEMMATHMNDDEMIEGEALDSNDKAIINSFFNEIEEANPDSSQHESEKGEDKNKEVIIEEDNNDDFTDQSVANSEREKAVADTDEEDKEVNLLEKEVKPTEEIKDRNPGNQWEHRRFPSEKEDKKEQHDELNYYNKHKKEIQDKNDEHKNDIDKYDEHHRTNSKHHKHSELPKKEDKDNWPPKKKEKDNKEFK
ncbi:anti-sigma-I factor RsgI family protein [Oceanobacillus kimchii]|uniref:anti-sigma factor domain-containing protein n=1 Tax=Oceanobacillus kimchii TaxID=746691 RepID=UPI003C77FE9C